MKLCTIGLGYIGLPTSIMFASHGVDVIGVDVKKEAIELLNNGKIHIEEPGLQDALESVMHVGKFRASLTPEKADTFIIAVPTPNKADEYKSCDITYVMQSVEKIIPLLEKGNVVIVESTIAPRTMNDHVKPRLEEAGFVIGEDIYLVHCPERVLPGQIMYELVHNNRIVGGITPVCTDKGVEVYETFVQGEIIKTNAKTAEMSKLMENTFRDVNIALANELTKVCNELDINALEVIKMANKHPRVHLHYPGPGVGGHCLAVDPYFIIAKAPEQAKMITLSREINNSMPEYVIQATEKLLTKNNGKKIAVFGLTYKGNVDDIRESPAMDIYEALHARSEYEVVAYDPHVNLSFVEKDIERALTGSDIVLILSDHKEFKHLTSKHFEKMNVQLVFDTKNVVNEHSDSIQYINFGNLYKFI
ncbi:nucleotide sugar dehydrogenase [Pseudogracilibacillus auburnensis]|uniref:UDP-N-acetyl-D-mannosaminuronic acid dehydrogenase n=1 Tax=Pseudogracilibacillus auburnensis TaxID=1494959 RepID=A0A2V3VV93_9BACI|nr:nucleotide sugar dehydrogenase [Pseudogracilibacillus auburnensis]PXW85857.1 UDP-N-acetyl-D-mannosaminuronic acid dehydrogenase [Pseudogracilibacillus auburnensis]